jgi:hypothetical protein
MQILRHRVREKLVGYASEKPEIAAGFVRRGIRDLLDCRGGRWNFHIVLSR